MVVHEDIHAFLPPLDRSWPELMDTVEAHPGTFHVLHGEPADDGELPVVRVCEGASFVLPVYTDTADIPQEWREWRTAELTPRALTRLLLWLYKAQAITQVNVVGLDGEGASA